LNDRILKILIHLLGHLKDNDLNGESLGEFSDGLVARGYDEKEVAEAIHWFLEKLSSRTIMSTEILEQKKESTRVLHDYERINIPSEVYGYLLKLKSMSVITGAQMEKILNYYMLIGSNSLNDSDINEIITSVLFEEY